MTFRLWRCLFDKVSAKRSFVDQNEKAGRSKTAREAVTHKRRRRDETWQLTVAPIRDGYSYSKTSAENPTLHTLQSGCLAAPQHRSCVTKTEILAQILYWSEYFSFCWQRRCKKLAKQLLNRVDCTTILGTLAVSVAWHPKTLVPLNWHISSVFNQNSGALNIVVGIGFPLFSESFEILLCQC